MSQVQETTGLMVSMSMGTNIESQLLRTLEKQPNNATHFSLFSFCIPSEEAPVQA